MNKAGEVYRAVLILFKGFDYFFTGNLSGIAGLGLLLQMVDKVPADKKILIVSTGKTKVPAVHTK